MWTVRVRRLRFVTGSALSCLTVTTGGSWQSCFHNHNLIRVRKNFIDPQGVIRLFCFFSQNQKPMLEPDDSWFTFTASDDQVSQCIHLFLSQCLVCLTLGWTALLISNRLCRKSQTQIRFVHKSSSATIATIVFTDQIRSRWATSCILTCSL